MGKVEVIRPLRRKEDKGILALWVRIAPYWHICSALIMAIFLGIMWYSTVNSAVAQTLTNTADIKTLQNDLATTRDDMSEIKGEVHAIALYFGIKPQR